MKNSCVVEACERQVFSRGWCNSHYKRWWRHGDPFGGGTMIGDPHRFLEKATAGETDECVLWLFARSRQGYAAVRHNGRRQLVSRIVCERVHGSAPSPKHEAAHSCGKGHLGCVNGRHIRWATPSENNADKLIHGTHNRGERQSNVKLKESQVREIWKMRGKLRSFEIAEKLNVSQATICDIFHGRTWAWLEVSNG